MTWDFDLKTQPLRERVPALERGRRDLPETGKNLVQNSPGAHFFWGADYIVMFTINIQGTGPAAANFNIPLSVVVAAMHHDKETRHVGEAQSDETAE